MYFESQGGALAALSLKPLRRFIARRFISSAMPPQELVGYRRLIASLFSTPTALIPGILVSCLISFLCWRSDGDPRFAVFTALAVVTAALRLRTLRRYRCCDHSADDRKRTRAWDVEYMLGATIMSLVVGLNGFFAFVSPVTTSLQMLVVAVNVGIGSGFIARNAARPYFALAQFSLFVAPIAVAMIMSNDVYQEWTGWLLVLYIAVNVSIVFNIHRNLVDLTRAKTTADYLSTQLQRRNVTLDAALNTLPHGAALFNDEKRLLVANARHSALYGLPSEIGHPPFDEMLARLVQSGVVDRIAAQALEQAYLSSVETRAPMKVETLTKAGAHLIVRFNPSSDDGILMFTEDATARKTAEAEVQRLARYDTLTGLPNRHEFARRLTQAFADLADGGPHFALLFLDLDGFKRINDTRGHEIGDGLLVEVAKRLKRFKSQTTMICRLGGDEFAAVCACGTDAAIRLAEEIGAALEEPFAIGNHVTRISVSIGVAFAPEHASNSKELLRYADIALYRAKAQGRGIALVYDAAMAEELTLRLSLEGELMAALAVDAFELHFQPIVDLTSGDVVSYEALARWPHPTRGYVPPGVFIPIAEQTGMIDQLGCFAIREACAIASGWDPSISVNVNVSVLQFRNPGLLVGCVRNAVAANYIAPYRLILEITESVFIDAMEETIDTIEQLKEIGVRFALDDFGVGYSSLSLLSRLPFSIVKIDRSLTKDIAGSTAAFAIVEAVCALAKRLELTVVVEGVETREQQLAVRLTGAERAQGWLFGRPEPAAKIAAAARRVSAA